jgi:hypothetical protein
VPHIAEGDQGCCLPSHGVFNIAPSVEIWLQTWV